MTSKSYESCKLSDLRDELKKRGMKVAGRKHELVTRLENLDAIGRGPEHLEPEYTMTLPERSSYKDIHNQMVLTPLPFNRIRQYYDINEKNFDEKFKELYKQRFIRYLRASEQNNMTYYTGCVWAEMKKSVSYTVDFCLDRNSVVQEAQCECGAGQGPSAHCKHVGCLMYAVQAFSLSGEIINEQTCTQVLQTFHKAKPHKGSPLTTTSLQAMRKHELEYDPRPTRFRGDPSYPANFRNGILNYQAHHADEGKMAMIQLYKPANPYATSLDHDYGESNEEHFLKHAKLHNVTEAERDDLERCTRGQCVNDTWRNARDVRITSSNFGKICKATERRDKDKLVQELINPVQFRSKATDYGRSYEAVAVHKFEEMFGKTTECGLFISIDNPWMGASPDRLYKDCCTVEVKCPYSGRDKSITDVTVPYLEKEGDNLRLKKSHAYYYQVQGQLLCAEKTTCYFCVFTQKDFCVIEIDRDDEFIDDMVSKLKSFFDNQVLPALLEKHVYKSHSKYF